MTDDVKHLFMLFAIHISSLHPNSIFCCIICAVKYSSQYPHVAIGHLKWVRMPEKLTVKFYIISIN